MLHEILEALTPLLIDLLALLLSLAIAWLSVQVHRYLGVQVEARHREALHSALMTGVRHALARGLQDQNAVAKAAVDYVRTSVPDALAALKPRQQQLIEMAEATLEGWRTGP